VCVSTPYSLFLRGNTCIHTYITHSHTPHTLTSSSHTHTHHTHTHTHTHIYRTQTTHMQCVFSANIHTHHHHTHTHTHTYTGLKQLICKCVFSANTSAAKSYNSCFIYINNKLPNVSGGKEFTGAFSKKLSR